MNGAAASALAALERAARQLRAAAYPFDIYCIVCGTPIFRGLPYAICGRCMQDLRWANGRLCEKCGKILPEWHGPSRCLDCLGSERFFDQGFSCVHYGEKERALVHAMKYKGKSYLARRLAVIMADRFRVEGLTADLIVPVPMHRQKARERGYDQAALIAGGLSRALSIPWRRDLLVRIRETGQMSGLDRKERRANVAGAFSATPAAARSAGGRTLLLVDDVFTTGSTADACAAALRTAGAARIYMLAFAAGIDAKEDCVRH